jgi:hypothetical protein
MVSARRSFPRFTHRARRIAALWALFALCLQLLAGGVSAQHAAERLAREAGDLCTTSAAAQHANPASQGEHHEGRIGPHCPFCVSHGGAMPLLVAALSFVLPAESDAASFLIDVAQAPPVAPALRHTPPRAPPLSLA